MYKSRRLNTHELLLIDDYINAQTDEISKESLVDYIEDNILEYRCELLDAIALLILKGSYHYKNLRNLVFEVLSKYQDLAEGGEHE
jgi:hypothetical protein